MAQDTTMNETRIRYGKIADALANLDSHSIYDERALEPLARWGIDVDKLTSHTRKQVASMIVERGLGGTLDPEAPDKLYSGYIVSDQVVAQLGLVPAGRMFHGRGSAHHANIEQLRKEATIR